MFGDILQAATAELTLENCLDLITFLLTTFQPLNVMQVVQTCKKLIVSHAVSQLQLTDLDLTSKNEQLRSEKMQENGARIDQ